MCLVCVDWIKGSLTSKEALRNLGEFVGSLSMTEEDRNHPMELAQKIAKKMEEQDENS